MLHAICAFISLIADADITFAPSAFVGGTLVAVASTDAETAGSNVVISSLVGVFFCLKSLAAVGLRPMIDVVVDLQREEEEGEWSRCYF